MRYVLSQKALQNHHPIRIYDNYCSNSQSVHSLCPLGQNVPRHYVTMRCPYSEHPSFVHSPLFIGLATILKTFRTRSFAFCKYLVETLHVLLTRVFIHQLCTQIRNLFVSFQLQLSSAHYSQLFLVSKISRLYMS